MDDRAYALTRSAQAHRDAGALEAAERDQREAVALYRIGDDPRRLGHAIRHLADIVMEVGRAPAAGPLCEEMLALYRADPAIPALEMANALRTVALHAELSGNRAEARRLWQDVRDRYCALGKSLEPGVREANRRLARLTDKKA